MRALKILTTVMAVMIVAGVVVLGIVISKRMGAPSAAVPTEFNEPAGTQIAQISAAGDRLALLLHGGGPDRVVVLDLRNGQVMARTALGQ